jgi:hypothetical protein
MTIADSAGEVAEVAYLRELFGFKDYVVVPKPLEFCESHIWSAAA